MKKTLSLALVVLMLTTMFTVFAVSSSADDGWKLEGGVLTLTQNIEGVYSPNDTYPWADKRSEITKVVVADGVTKLSNHSFTQCPNLVEVVTGKNCVEFGSDAFSNCTKLESITFGAAVTTIGQGIVYGSKAIKTVTLTNQSKDQFKAVATVNSYNFESKGGIATGFDTAEFKTVGTVAPTKLELTASFGRIENYGSPLRTYFIVGGISMAIIQELKDGTMSAKVVVIDETENKTYTISKYAFDAAKNLEADTGNGLFRVAACEYGIPVAKDNAYTIAVEISDAAGTVMYSGTSGKGAFTKKDNEHFNTNGAIVPETVTHYYDEYKAPVNPPVTGEHTAVIVVLAVVALFGTAVVVSKKVLDK